MAVNRVGKKEKKPNYSFLVSWDPKDKKTSYVNRETKNKINSSSALTTHKKNADSLAQAEPNFSVRKDIIRSLITISLVLILELMVYLAWIKIIK